MKTIFTTLLPALLLLTTSCNMILMKAKGIKNPDVENAASIHKKALKYHLDTAAIVTINSSDFLRTLKSAGSIPEAALFDRSGAYIEYRATDTSCNAGLFDFIPQLRPDGQFNKTMKTDLFTESARFRTINGQPLDFKTDSNTDFYALIYWSVWTGGLNKDHVNVWEDLALANPNAKIKVLLVNLDIQEWWDPAERAEIEAMLSKKK